MRSVSEKIDERILRLLGLEDVFDLDYDTYLILLKEAIVTGSKKLPQEELALLANERKRVRGKKGRFNPKKQKITVGKVATTKFLKPTKKTLTLSPSQINVSGDGGKGLIGIRKTLDSILSILATKFKFDQKQSEDERKETEREKRGKKESNLEGFKKGVASIVSVTKKMLSPFQVVIDKIWKFIFFTLLGRAFTKFMEWMGDKENRKKFDSFIEFLTDHWPALAGLYILFGTGFGKLVRGLLKGVARMTVALLTNLPKIKNFISKHRKLAFLGVALAPLASRELGNLFADKETPESGLIPKTNPELNDAKKSIDQSKGGDLPKFNFGGMIPKFAMGGIRPFGMGMDLQSGVPITGAGQDNTLIAAKTGEAILTERDQADLNQRYVDRATGEPLNVPQYLAGRKPGSVSLGNIGFPGFGGGFSGGGIIPKFNNGGIIPGGPFTPLPSPGYVRPQGSFIPRPILRLPGPMPGTTVPFGYDPFRGLQGGGLIGGLMNWYNKGRNVRIPNEGQASWRQLLRDDMSQRGKFQTPSGLRGWNPGWSFTSGLGTGPTPLGRQVVERGIPRIALPFQLGYQMQAPFSRWSARQRAQRNKANMMMEGYPGYQRGGHVKENTGMNIRGATADRQLTALQPGEYVLPVDTVNRLGLTFVEKLVAMTDSNSNAYLRKSSINKPQITPYKNGMSGMVTLPPIDLGAGGGSPRAGGYAGGSKTPSFSAVSPIGDRDKNAKLYYGIG